MDLPRKRTRKITEWVIDTGDEGIDAKQFNQSVRYLQTMMAEDGVDLSYDDAFTVMAGDGEIVFSYEKKRD